MQYYENVFSFFPFWDKWVYKWDCSHDPNMLNLGRTVFNEHILIFSKQKFEIKTFAFDIIFNLEHVLWHLCSFCVIQVRTSP